MTANKIPALVAMEGAAFEVIQSGWPGAGFATKYVRIEAHYVRRETSKKDEAQLIFQTSTTSEKGRTSHVHSSMELGPKDATELAAAIAPPEVALIINNRERLIGAITTAFARLDSTKLSVGEDLAHAVADALLILGDAIDVMEG